MKMKLNGYYRPTPKKMRKIGDGLLAVSALTATVATVYNHPAVTVFSVIAGALGKFVTNFFVD